MKKSVIWISIVFLTAGLTSCVSMKKFNTMQQQLSSENEQLKQENEKLSVENREMKRKTDLWGKHLEELSADSALKEIQLKETQLELEQLRRNYAELQQAQEDLLKGNERETARLMKQLQSTQEDLAVKENRLKTLERDLNDKGRKLDALGIELDQRNARLTEMENILARKDSAVLALKNKVTDALLGFEKEGLSVRIQNGKVYVSLEEKLLFKSGSTEVDPKGINALKKLAKVLEQNQDINITIEGHTDDVPMIPSNGMKDNWDLSVKRATSIVRILLEGNSISPKRLTASGRGEFLPVAAGKTAESRQKNRRTEIILTPKLDELFRILESN
jgi:chemotaxis protein MotB